MSALRHHDLQRTLRDVYRLVLHEHDGDRLVERTAELLAARLDGGCFVARLGAVGDFWTYSAGLSPPRELVRRVVTACVLRGGGVDDPSPAEEVPVDEGAIVAPLSVDGRTLGTLILTLPSGARPEAEAIESLRALGLDLAFALRERARAAQERAEARRVALSERRLRTLIENVSDVLWVLDLDAGRFVFVSPSVARLRGYSPEEVLAGGLGHAATPDLQQRIARAVPGRVAALLAGVDRTYVDAIELPCKDGSLVRTETVTRLVRDPETGHVYAYGASRGPGDRGRAGAA